MRGAMREIQTIDREPKRTGSKEGVFVWVGAERASSQGSWVGE